MSSLHTPARARIALPTDLNTTARRVRPEWIFAVFAVVATVWLMYKGRHFTFQGDEWDWILHRRGHSPAAFLRPHVEHLSALPIAVYKLLLAEFGDRSTFPFRLVDAVLAALTASLTFVFVARRLGGWIALAPATVLLVLGPGWDDILWSFQMGYLFSLVAGLGALLVLERRDRRGDVAACVLLIIGIAASSVGIMVLVGALVLVLFSVRSRGWRRLWVVGVPAALYAIWYSKYGVSSVRISNLHLVPVYSFDGLGAVLGSLTGLTSPDNTAYLATPEPGTSLAAILVVGFGLRFLLGGPLSPRFWSVTAIAVAFWLAAALDHTSFREANASRYIYAVAPFVIVAMAECFRGWRLPRIRGMALLYVAATVAVVSNLSFLNQGADVFDVTSEFARGELAALQVSRGIVSPAFHPESPAISSIIGAHNMIPIDAGSYFAAVVEFGSPADTVPQLLRAPEEVREASDLVVAKAERITITAASATNHAVCQPTVARGGSVTLSSGPGTLLFAAAGPRPSRIALRRFAAANHYVVFNRLPASRALALALPRDGSNAPWHVQVFTAVPISVCRL